MYAALLVFLGGGLGSLVRFLIAKGTLKFYPSNFPMGTFLANIISCLILAVVLIFISQKQFGSDHSTFRFLLITGFCGGLSTFSTFSFETLELIKNNMWGLALLNVGLSLILGVGIMFVLMNKTT